MNKNFHNYYAFICHRSSYEAIALKIQRKLERYRIPRLTRRENHFETTHIRNVFVDDNELIRPELADEIVEKIHASDKLIVLCTPDSAKPVDGSNEWINPEEIDWKANPVKTGWIGFEIRHFMDKNPKEKIYENIIPVVVDGNPDEVECFHPLLKHEIDKGKLKWVDYSSTHFIDELVTKVLTPIDEETFRQRNKARRMCYAIAAVLVSLILCVTAFFMWDYFTPHENLYKDYILVEGKPVGLDKIPLFSTGEKREHYSITIQKSKKTITFKHLNAKGIPVPDENENHPDAPMIAKYKYRDNGNVETVEYYDRNGIVQIAYAYATDLRYVDFQENEFVSDQVYPIAEINDYGIPNRMEIDRYEFVWDEDGRVKQKLYRHGDNYVIDDTGVSGEEYEYDNEGRVSAIYYIAPDGERSLNKDGIGGILFQYDTFGSVVRKSYVKSDNELTYGQNGYAERCIEYSGNDRVYTYYDVKGNPIVCKHYYAKLVQSDNQDGLLESISYYGLKGQPVYSRMGYHKIVYSYDDQGNVACTSYYGFDENPILGKDGYAKEECKYDEYGNLTERSTYGTDGQLLICGNHASTEKRKYTDEGYVSQVSFYGINGDPVMNDKGYHREVKEYDEKGRLNEVQYYGISDEAVYCRSDESYFHQVTFEYDNKGNLGAISLFTPEGNLVSTANGHWAKKECVYGGNGQVRTVKYRDSFGKLADIAGNYAYLENVYDDRGLLTSTSYYDKQGKLSSDLRYNSGVQIGDRFYAKAEFEYNKDGNVVKKSYYDEDGKLIKNYLYAIEADEYDEIGRIIHISYTDPEGGYPADYHSDVYLKYDEYGHRISWKPLRKGINPDYIINQNGDITYGETYAYDVYGNVLEQVEYKQSGEVLLKTEYEYDQNGMLIGESYYDSEGKGVIHRKGYAKKVITYDERYNEAEIAYFDAEDLPLLMPTGYHLVKMEYNENNVQYQKAYFGKSGEAVDCSAGFSVLKEDINDYRSTTKGVFYDKNGIELFSYHANYNDYGLKEEEWLSGPDGSYLENPEYGIALIKYYYDDNRFKVREEYYNEDLQPAKLFGFVSGWESEYSSLGLELERSTLGAGFNPTADDNGIVRIEFHYDTDGRENERVFLDSAGKELNSVFGFSRYTIEYDEGGDIINCRFWDEDGKEVTEVAGKVENVVLAMHDGSSVELVDSDVGTLAFAHTAYNVNRIAYHEGDTYDLMLQYYVPFNPGTDAAKIIKEAKKKYRIAFDGVAIDLYSYGEDGKVAASILDRYIEIIRTEDVEGLFGLLGDISSSLEAAIQMLQPYATRMPTKEEIYDLYYRCYADSFSQLNEKVKEEFGKDYSITYEVTDLEKSSAETIKALNEQLRQLGLSMKYTDMMNLNVRFKVKGNQKSEYRTEEYFYPRMTILKLGGEWTLGTSEGFPKPDSTDLAALFGIGI